MIISRCPLRISLAGGSTDLQPFLNKYNRGSVIGFPSSLLTYIFINKKNGKSHRIVYSKTEDIDYHDFIKIENNVVRECLKFIFEKRNLIVPPCEIIFQSDIPSTGSGLASSSSYTISLLNGLYALLNIKINDLDLCKEAIEIERNFNPLVGYQDIYQSCLPFFKRLNFTSSGLNNMVRLSSNILEESVLYLLPTGKIRSSTEILKSLDIDSCLNLLPQVDELERSILDNNAEHFMHCINQGWENKKKTSPEISNSEISQVEEWINTFKSVRAKRLCGAGGGGYFLIICSEPVKELKEKSYLINVNDSGSNSILI